MACQLILKELKSGNHENVFRDVNDYLLPVLNEQIASQAEKATYGLCVVKILHTSLECVTSEKVSQSLLNVIHCCYQGYQKTKTDVKLGDPLTVLKILYHLLAKLPYKDYRESLLLIGSYLYEESCDIDNDQLKGTVTTIAHNAYSTLWNIAVKLEQDSEHCCALRLRHAALKIAFLSKNTIGSVMEKLLLAVNRFDKMIVQSKNRQQSEDTFLPLDVTQNLVLSLGHHSSTVLNDQDAYSLLLVDVYRMKFSLQHKQTMDCVSILQNTLSQVSSELSEVYTTVQKQYQAITTLLSFQSNSKSDKNISIKNILLMLKDFVKAFGKNWSTVWYTPIRELYMVLFRQLGIGNKLLPVDLICGLIQGLLAFLTVVVSTDSKKCEGSGSLDKGNVDLVQTSLRMVHKYLQASKDDKEFTQIVEEVLKLSEIYNKVLESDKIEWSEKLCNQERYYCGYLMSKMGHVCCNHGNNATAVTFYTISCEQLSTWARSDLSLLEQRLEEISLWRVYECLAECQKKCGDLDSAMNTIVTCLLVDSSHVASSVKFWVKIKKELLKEGKAEVENSVLGLLVRSKGEDNSLDITTLLMLELKGFRNLRTRYYEAELAILNAVLKVAECPCVRARALLDIGQIIWLTGISKNKSVYQYTQEALDEVSGADNPVSSAILAEICVWQYIMDHETACHEVQVLSEQEFLKESKRINQTDSKPGEESDPPSTNSGQFKVVYTFNMEVAAMEKLNKALELWDTLLKDQCCLDDKIDHSAMFSCMLLCSNILRLSRKINSELKLLNLALKMTETYPELDSAVVHRRLAQISLLTGDLPETEGHPFSVTSNMSVETLTELQSVQREAGLQALLLKAEGLLHAGQVNEGSALLCDLLNFVESQPIRSKSVCMAEGTAKRLLSMFQGLPGRQHEDYDNWYVLDLALDAVRMHTGVLKFLLGKDFLTGVTETQAGHSLDKWSAVAEVLQSLLHAGQVYTLIGEAREAKCYLTEGRKISHYMCLPFWTATFLQELSRVHSLSDRRDDWMCTVQDIHHLYSSKSLTTARVTGPGTDKPHTQKVQEKKSGKKLPENNNNKGCDNEEDRGYPNVVTLMPPCYDHVANQKSCDICNDFLTCLSVLTTSLDICQWEVEMENFDSAENILKDLKFASDNLISTKSVHKVEKSEMKPLKVKKVGIKDKSPKEIICNNINLKAVFLQTSNLLSKLHLCRGDTKGCAEKTQININKCQNVFRGTSFQVCHLEAQLQLHLVHCKYEFLFIQKQSKKDLIKMTPTDSDNIININSVTSKMSCITLEENTEVGDNLTEMEVEEPFSKIAEKEMENLDVVQEGLNKPLMQNKVKPRNNKKTNKMEKEDQVIRTRCKKDLETVLEKKSEKRTLKLVVEEESCNSHVPVKNKSINNVLDINGGFSTPVKQHYMYSDEKGCGTLPLKTPRSVCSRSAGLRLLLDDSDEEDISTTKRGRGKRAVKESKSTKKTNVCNNKDVESVKAPTLSLSKVIDSDRNSGKISNGDNNILAKNKSKIPCPVRKQKVPEQETVKEYEMEIELNTQTKPSGKRSVAKKNVVTSAKVTGKRGTKTTQRKATEIECQRECQESDSLPRPVTESRDIYDFDEVDDPSDSKIKSTKTVRTSKSKKIPNGTKGSEKYATSVQTKRMVASRRVEHQETARFETHELQEKKFDLEGVDVVAECEDSILLDKSLEMESNLDAVSFNLLSFVGEGIDDLDKYYIQTEELLELDDSIEIPRSDDQVKKKTTATRKGRGRKKVETEEVSDGHQNETQKSRDTTEIMRSTHGIRHAQATKQPEPCRAVSDPTMISGIVPDIIDNSVTSVLEKAFDQVRHFPSCGLYSTICNLLALQHLESSPLDAVFYLCEAMAVTFRHQALANTGKKLRKLKQQQTAEGGDSLPTESAVENVPQDKQKLCPSSVGQESSLNELRTVQSKLSFSKTPEDLQASLKQIPDGMTVCQLSLVTHPKHPASLLVSRLENGVQPVAVHLPGFSSLQGQQILPEFSAIIEESRQSTKITKKTEWWKTRHQLDDRMHSLLDSMERYWLGHWKVMLLGNPWSTPEDREKIVKLTSSIGYEILKITTVQPSLVKLQLLLQSVDYLSDHQLCSALSELTGHPTISSTVNQMRAVVREKMKDLDLCSEYRKRQHVILVLDKSIQHLPWENIPVLRNHSVSRVPSFYHMCVQLSYLQEKKSSILHRGIDSRNTFFILNPDSDLMSTQETFESWFKKEEGWEGFVGEKPTSEQFKEALTQRDLLLYCGHGSGSKYFHGDDLQQVNCQAAAILMGCSSGRLQVKGHLEASGMMLNYFLSGCPCIVANLWDVTDRDIDRFLESLLTTWMAAEKPSRLQDVIPSARQACRLPYLIGSAPVVYGFPVFLQS